MNAPHMEQRLFHPRFTPHMFDAPARNPNRIVLVNGFGRKDNPLVRLARAILEDHGAAVTVIQPDGLKQLALPAHGVIVLAPAASAPACAFEGMAPPDRVYGMVVQGDAGDAARRALSQAMNRIGWIDADAFASLNHHFGYYDPAAGQQPEPDYEEEVRNVVDAVLKGVTELRAGRLSRRQ
jgi:hypothetical protein